MADMELKDMEKTTESEIVYENHDDFIEKNRSQIRKITVEPLLLFYMVILYLQNAVINQYVYYRVGLDYNLADNSSLAHVCNSKDIESSLDKERTDKIQKINSYYLMIIFMSNAVFTILTAPFYSVFSDQFGRRFMFLLPGFGAMVKSILEVLVISLNGPLWVFFVSEAIYGCSGGFHFATGLAYIYVADITTQKQRTLRMALLGVIMAIGALGVSLCVGFWIQNKGYLAPYVLSVFIAIAAFLYPILFLKEPPKMPNAFSTDSESSDDKKKPVFIIKHQMKTLFQVYYKNRSKAQASFLIVLALVFNFYYVAEMSGLSLIHVYLMAFPICMNAQQLGIFAFINLFAVNVGIAISLFILKRYFNDLTIVLFCLLSGVLFSLQMAFATEMYHTFIAAASNILSFSAFPFLRGIFSRMVSPKEQGALFGGLTMFETIGGAITKVVVVYFYRETFLIFHGMVFIFICLFSVVAISLTIAAKYLQAKMESVLKEQTFISNGITGQ